MMTYIIYIDSSDEEVLQISNDCYNDASSKAFSLYSQVVNHPLINHAERCLAKIISFKEL